jgi:hypothetical protein
MRCSDLAILFYITNQYAGSELYCAASNPMWHCLVRERQISLDLVAGSCCFHCAPRNNNFGNRLKGIYLNMTLFIFRMHHFVHIGFEVFMPLKIWIVVVLWVMIV